MAGAPLRAPSSPPDTPMPMYLIPFSATSAARLSVFSYLPHVQCSKQTVHNCAYLVQSD
jgi:hypothetical protein